MAAVDREYMAGSTSKNADELIARAGAAVARAAVRLLGGTYGRRVVVVAGKGNNGADGRVAAVRLSHQGVAATVIDATAAPDRLPSCDLVIDAAYGTGFRGRYMAPDPGPALVLAVDIPSGIDGLTGAIGGNPVRAHHTVTFAALKPGLVLFPGREHAGVVTVADIGLDVSRAGAAAVELADVVGWIPVRGRNAHKWDSAVWVVAGSPGMRGAATLCAGAAMRTGAGMVTLGTPGGAAGPTEVVGHHLPGEGWDVEVLAALGRSGALVVGPGLGRSLQDAAAIRRLVAAATVPVVVDADGLWALGTIDQAAEVLGGRVARTVLTPHDGEFVRLVGRSTSGITGDRIADTRFVAARLGATVLRKGATTVVADPDGTVLLVAASDSRLATAGTGDVLAGVIAALLAGGLDGCRAAAAGAFAHAQAAELGWKRGLVASDLLDHLPAVMSGYDRR